MSRFTTRRYEQILTQMIAHVVSRTRMSDISDTAVVKHVLAASSRQDDEQYYQMNLLLQLFSIDTATGEDLDERAKDIMPGLISRNPAGKAVGNVIFSRVSVVGTVNIAVGTKIKTADGSVFSTTAAGQITPGNNDSALVPIVADEGGEDGNVASGTIVKFVQKPTGVDSVSNPSACRFGTNKETDSSFRNRLRQFILGLARSTVDALEVGVLGAVDENTGATILFSKVVEDFVNLGNVTEYIDDGTGSAESTAETRGTVIAADLDWDGTTSVETTDSSELAVDDYIGLTTDGQFFRITNIVPGTPDVITITNPGALTIPVGSGAGASTLNPENLCDGLAGPPQDHAVGGEEYLKLLNIPVKAATGYSIVSSSRGVLVEGTDYYLNPASGQVNFIIPLTAGEAVFGLYTHYTGLIALAQKIVDGDLNDRGNYPGIRAAGVLVIVQTPQVITQSVTTTVTISAGYDHQTVRDAVEDAVEAYINSLGISGDLLLSELIYVIMGVPGVYNATISVPATDIILLDDQIPRAGTITVY